MAVSQNLAEIGWFYHAPEPPKKSTTYETPLASQIPGLNDLSSIPHEDSPRPLFRDTDTKYIRMAKMGGREDLLRHRDPKPKAKEAVAYPRSDWYYLEDNKMEDDSIEHRPWEFRLPEYMVHDEHKPFGDGYDYRNDPEGLIYWKKGRVAPGAPEIKHVSRGQSSYHPMTAPPVPAVIAKPASGRNHESEKDTRYPDVPAMYGSGRPAMNKLLAYGYANEWESARDEWHDKVRSLEDEERNANAAHMQQNRSAKSTNKNMMWNDLRSRQTQPTNASRRVMSNTSTQANKPLFKISKFENVAARVNSHNVLPPI